MLCFCPFLGRLFACKFGYYSTNHNRMKRTTRIQDLRLQASPDTDHDGILTLLAILLGEIVIIDVMGL